ncbi:MAG TPA: hypothetical protein VK338_00770, partial [Candidatus Nitrosocosmicus sp.]|nr:hypothetical protein [Candidatus Nitrosocosmicus sp.]
GIIFFVNSILFSASYFYNKWLEPQYIIVIYSIITMIYWLSFSFKLSKKIALIIGLSLLSTISGFVFLLSTMFIPGSKEHNYVMYSVCYPALMKYYKINKMEDLPMKEIDKNGFGKWWYQHSECENNVYAGKGPIFSDNPPGFIVK